MRKLLLFCILSFGLVFGGGTASYAEVTVEKAVAETADVIGTLGDELIPGNH
ncbi:hypothetical protein [Bacillus marinisedimentorum]|uniref:hypothetical protein n=1 Tax=Bacillus marinisedimentorum TaxID=1821260 RepID=UPI0012FFABAE|nr:hypothetical protein [Bacillus marinisedimentorum]